jgi:ABC-type transport system involved in multi-copper enzyme maturation permease subunit
VFHRARPQRTDARLFSRGACRVYRDAMAELVAWDSFYVIVGSAAGALIGFQFVVITLIAQRPTTPAPEASAAFGTPTIVHFGAALLLSALVRAPWQTIAIPAILWAVVGLSGTIYALNVIRRMRAQGVYEPQFEDWLFHVVLPVSAYAILALSAFAALSHTRESLFGIGAAALLPLFIGIHNAWDAVFYHVFFSRRDNDTRP